MKNKKVVKSLIEFVNGKAFTGKEIVDQLPYLMFLVFMALTYIANGYWAENSIRSINKTGNELKEMRSEYITTKSELMYKSKQSEIAAAIKERKMELEESIVPPKKIVVELNPKQLKED